MFRKKMLTFVCLGHGGFVSRVAALSVLFKTSAFGAEVLELLQLRKEPQKKKKKMMHPPTARVCPSIPFILFSSAHASPQRRGRSSRAVNNASTVVVCLYEVCVLFAGCWKKVLLLDILRLFIVVCARISRVLKFLCLSLGTRSAPNLEWRSQLARCWTIENFCAPPPLRNVSISVDSGLP